ncbi:hypothetical protein BOTBODRAFT_182506 [Botryobasidium botryosum FD-172 SS1]|uniref:Uncharacterized protein n=1 Tax=Botryobasidium botryosum (strain FD-172 SS1) TaxID=930990 RepID=A0A067LR91_BOTB1|nr:hypothetical protein BOTBODRAFT_182506 [Botryobasidium botryosum FD-172 SS1]
MQRLGEICSSKVPDDAPVQGGSRRDRKVRPQRQEDSGPEPDFASLDLRVRRAIVKSGGTDPARLAEEKYRRIERRLEDSLAAAKGPSRVLPALGRRVTQQPTATDRLSSSESEGDPKHAYLDNRLAQILADARSSSGAASAGIRPQGGPSSTEPRSDSDSSDGKFSQARQRLQEIIDATSSLVIDAAALGSTTSPVPWDSPLGEDEVTDLAEFDAAYTAAFRVPRDTPEPISSPDLSASEPQESTGRESVYEPPALEYHGLNLDTTEGNYSDGGDSLLGELGGTSGIRVRYLSSPDLWRQALGELPTLGDTQWLEQSVMNYYLLDVWFRLRTARGIYLDTRIAGLWGAEAPLRRYIGERIKPLLRRNFSLPAKGACPPQPVVFFVREEVEGVGGHFFTVVADVESRVVYTLGRWDDTPWDDWHSPKYYKHVCSLFGWQGGRVSQVAVRSTPLRQNSYNCGPQAVAAAVHVMESGMDLEDSGQMRVPPVRCGHFIRLRMYRQLLSSCCESMELYESLLTSPPDEWQAASLEQIDFAEWFPPTQAHYDLVYAAGMEDDPVARRLQASVDGCSRCRSRPDFRLGLSSESKGMEGLLGMDDEEFDFDESLDGEILDWDFEHADSPGGVVPDADMRVEDGDPSESDGDGPSGSRRQPGRLRILAQIRHNPTVRRFPRPTLPPDVPAPPAGPGLWLHHPPPPTLLC